MRRKFHVYKGTCVKLLYGVAFLVTTVQLYHVSLLERHTKTARDVDSVKQVDERVALERQYNARRCQPLTSQLGNGHNILETVSDLTDWTFKKKQKCDAFPVTKPKPVDVRSEVRIDCSQSDFPNIQINQTSNFSFVQTVPFKDPCLSKLIDSCCRDNYAVPNIVHYVWFGTKPLAYFNFLSLMSVQRFVRPCVTLIHGPDVPTGEYWERFLGISPKVVHVYRERPTKVFGNTLRFKEHSSDIMRIEALLEYGGIYLDFDEVVLRPLDSLRRFPHTQGHELSFTMGSQLVMSERGSEFVKLWYQSYRDDYRKIWAYNALWVPNKLAKQHPELIHVEGYNFTRPSWQKHKLIFEGNYDWRWNYGMHMYARWYKNPINVHIIRTLNTTIGSVSRHILFGNKELCTD